MARQIYRGSASILLNVYIQRNPIIAGSTIAVGGLSGLTASSAGLTAAYFVEGAVASVPFALAPVSLGTWVSGGFTEVDPVNMPGVYALGVPNLAVEGDQGMSVLNGQEVTIFLRGAADMQDYQRQLELTATNVQDNLRFGLASLPAGPMMFKKAQALNGFVFPMFNSVDGRTPMPGLTVTASVSKDGNAPVFTDNSPTELISPLISGIYVINLTASDTNGNTVTYFFSAPGAQTTEIEIITQP